MEVCLCEDDKPCDHVSGKCDCPPGFTGSSCQESKYDLVPWQVQQISGWCDSCQGSMILLFDSCQNIKYNLVTWKLHGHLVWSCHLTEKQKVWSCHLTVIRTKSMILSPDSVTVVRTVSMILSCDSCHDSVILSSDSYMDSKYDLVLWVVRTVCIILKCDSCQDSRYNFVTWQIDSCLDSKYDLVKLSGQSVWSCHVAVVRDWFCHMIL